MQLTRKISLDTFYVGSSDRRLELFENIYPIERGVSYNSYLVMDEKTVLLDGPVRILRTRRNIYAARGQGRRDPLLIEADESACDPRGNLSQRAEDHQRHALSSILSRETATSCGALSWVEGVAKRIMSYPLTGRPTALEASRSTRLQRFL